MNKAGKNHKTSPSKQLGMQNWKSCETRKQTGRIHKKAYAMIFKEFCPSHMQNRIKYHLKYNIIFNDNLKLMDTIYQ